jgi:ABC-type nitrate/sulfonate/bicarbonate transport system substrate-binding protein
VRAYVKLMSLSLVLALAVGGCGSLAPTATPLRHLRVAFPAKDAHYAPYLIAIEKGYFAQEGLEVEILDAAGNVGVDAVIAGDAEFTTSAGVALSAILKGAPLKIVFSHMDRPNYEIWSSQPGIQQIGDLEGKAVGVIGRGDSTEISTRMALIKRGLDPNGVAYTALGPGGSRLAAVQSGAVAAAVLSITDVEQLKKVDPRSHLVLDVANDVSMLFNGAATTDRLLRDEPAVVAGFLRAVLKGREYFKQYRDETLDVVGRYNGQPRETTEPVYRSIVPAMTADGTLSDDAQRADAKVRAALIGADGVRPIEQIFDYATVRRVGGELQRSGWRPVR